MTPLDIKRIRHSLRPTRAEVDLRLPNHRTRAGLSAVEFARRLDSIRPPDPRTVRRWEAGDVPLPEWAERRIRELEAIEARAAQAD